MDKSRGLILHCINCESNKEKAEAWEAVVATLIECLGNNTWLTITGLSGQDSTCYTIRQLAVAYNKIESYEEDYKRWKETIDKLDGKTY